MCGYLSPTSEGFKHQLFHLREGVVVLAWRGAWDFWGGIVCSWQVGSSTEMPCVHHHVGTVLLDLFAGHHLVSALLSQAGAQLTSGLLYCILASLSKSF